MLTKEERDAQRSSEAATSGSTPSAACMPAVEMTPPAAALRAYAVRTSPTTLSIVLTNTGAEDLSLMIDVGGSPASANARRLFAPSIDATDGVTFGGVTVATDGSWLPTPPEVLPITSGVVSLTLPAASAALVEVTLSSGASDVSTV